IPESFAAVFIFAVRGRPRPCRVCYYFMNSPMTTLAEFLELLFDEGRVAFTDAPATAAEEQSSAVDVLQRAFDAYRLDIAGPLLHFDADVALAAAKFVQLACWFLINRQEPSAELEQRLRVPDEPKSAEQHLSADLTFRCLPQVHRRARALSPGDPLTLRIEE